MAEFLHILSRENVPEFILDPQGLIKIKGRGLLGPGTETAAITNWIDDYLRSPAESTLVIIALEYLNSYSTTTIVNFLKKLSGVLLKKGKLRIQWYYEEDDDDIMERGEYISNTFNLPITFVATNDISNCC
jgi:hypothetical protein